MQSFEEEKIRNQIKGQLYIGISKSEVSRMFKKAIFQKIDKKKYI